MQQEKGQMSESLLLGGLLAMAGGVTALAESELQEKILRERFMEPQEREKLDIRRQLPEHGRIRL